MVQNIFVALGCERIYEMRLNKQNPLGVKLMDFFLH